MKPARSPQITGLLPSLATSPLTSSRTSSSVTTVRTISTRFCTGAGLKKWTPMTRPGWRFAVEISVTLRLEVLVARIVSGFTIPSSSRKIDFLMSIDSTTASTTKSASARSLRLVVKVTRPTSSAWSSSLSLPRLTARPVECSRCWRPRSTASSVTSTPTTENPLRANTSAMPAPIVPSPTTPIVVNSRLVSCRARRHRWDCSSCGASSHAARRGHREVAHSRSRGRHRTSADARPGS